MFIMVEWNAVCHDSGKNVRRGRFNHIVTDGGDNPLEDALQLIEQRHDDVFVHELEKMLLRDFVAEQPPGSQVTIRYTLGAAGKAFEQDRMEADAIVERLAAA